MIPGNLELIKTRSNLSLFRNESKGLSFTWMNKRQGDDFVMEKLDRSFDNIERMETHLHSLVKNLPILCSDHGPIILDTECRPPFGFKWM